VVNDALLLNGNTEYQVTGSADFSPEHYVSCSQACSVIDMLGGRWGSLVS
jgi:hypothetical protein